MSAVWKWLLTLLSIGFVVAALGPAVFLGKTSWFNRVNLAVLGIALTGIIISANFFSSAIALGFYAVVCVNVLLLLIPLFKGRKNPS